MPNTIYYLVTDIHPNSKCSLIESLIQQGCIQNYDGYQLQNLIGWPETTVVTQC